jgi:hypothetical protein
LIVAVRHVAIFSKVCVEKMTRGILNKFNIWV